MQYRRAGLCLGLAANTSAAVKSGVYAAMTACEDPTASWRLGHVRGLQALLSARFHGTDPKTRAPAPLCLHIGVDPATMKCRVDPSDPVGNNHTPHVRQCKVDTVPGKGGNPVGCGFAFDAETGTITSKSCVDEPNSCLGVANASDTALSIVSCQSGGARGWSMASLRR